MDNTIAIPSKLEYIELVSSRIIPYAREIGFNSNRLSELELALYEVISNAITHGNKLNEDKKVIVEWKQKGNSLRVSVEDEGEGFNFPDIPDPLASENMIKERGRGIYLIRKIVKEVKFNSKGNRVTFLITK